MSKVKLIVQETYGDTKLNFSYDANGNPYTFSYTKGDKAPSVYHYVLNLQGDVVRIVTNKGVTRVTYEYDAWGNITNMTYTNKTLADANPLRYRGYYYDQETGLYYLQSRYYNPQWGRFINADGYVSTGQGVLGNNMFAYCGNNPIRYIDPYGTYIVPEDPVMGLFYMNVGGSALGVSTTTYAGSSGGVPVPMVDLQSIWASIDVVCDVADAVNMINTSDVIDAGDAVDLSNSLSHADEYGIKGYSTLKKELAGTGLEAHHIVEVRFLEGLGLDTKHALSVAVTKGEHQVFTNLWRDRFAYGKTIYDGMDPMLIWDAAQDIYRGYADLLEAVWRTLF